MILPAAPKRVPITVGLVNSTMSEITSGLNVGDEIISQTIKGTTATTAAPAGSTSALRALGGGGGFGGARPAGN